MPIHVTSGAKIIMAYSEPDFVDKLLERKLVRLTPNTITDPDALKANLIEYHRQGVAFDYGEMDIDVHTIAAPIFNYEKKPVAAAVVVVPANRMDKKEVKSKIIKSVKETSRLISSKLFYSEIREKKRRLKNGF